MLIRLDVEARQFNVFLDKELIRQVDIRGLYNGEMDFYDYMEYIVEEARSEAQRLKYQRRWQRRAA